MPSPTRNRRRGLRIDRRPARAYNPPMRTVSGLCLWGEGRPGLAEPLDPAALAGAHPTWAADVERFGPWALDGGVYRSQSVSDGPGVLVCGPCASALDVARVLAEEGALGEWGAVLAVDQSAGRGQLRRTWLAGPGDLMAAWRWPALSPEWDPLLPLLVGAAVAGELAQRGLAVRVKWPNDLLLDEAKVGGVLVEERGGTALAGIGLNLAGAPPDAAIRESWSPRAGSLGQSGAIKSIISLWRSLVDRAENWYQSKVSGSGPAHFLESFTLRLAWLGRQVRVHGAEGEYTAVPLGLAPDGGLILDRDGERVTLHSGSLSLP